MINISRVTKSSRATTRVCKDARNIPVIEEVCDPTNVVVKRIRNEMNSTMHYVIGAHNNKYESNQDQTHQHEVRPSCCLEISDNDVLIVGDDDHGFKLIDDDHIGNKRFQVFLKLYGEEYKCAMFDNNQGEMTRIVDTILDIVCRKCVRRGRFLRRVFSDPVEGGEKSKWEDLGEGCQAQQWVHQALSHSAVEGQTEVAHSERTPQFLNHLHSPPTSTQCVDASEQRNVLRSDLSCSLKRQRRESRAVLRRTASDGAMLRILQKQAPLHNEPHDDCNLVSSLSLLTNSEGQVATHRTMDVVFASCRSRLAPTGNPGNARLEITVGMHASAFGKSDILEQRRIVEDVISTVEMHWKGRFLVQNFLGSCKVLTAEAAAACIRTLILQEGERNSVRSTTQPNPMAPPLRMSSKRSFVDCDKSLNQQKLPNDYGEDICHALRLAMSPTPSLKNFKLSTSSLVPSALSAEDVGSHQPVAAGNAMVEHHPSEIPFQRPLPPTANVAADTKLRNAAISSLKARQKKRELMDRFFAQKKRTPNVPAFVG